MAANKKASNSDILKQVIYEMLSMAYLVEILAKNRCIKGQSGVESNDVLQSAVAVKFRLLYDFLYTRRNDAGRDNPADAYSAHDDFGMTVKKPVFTGLSMGGMFTGESISKYVLHLSSERITKPKEIPQPKFKGGNGAYLKNTALLLASAEKLIDSLVEGNYMNLNMESENCFKDFKKAVERLKEIPQFKASY